MDYFDHNATTPVDERVLEAMQPYFRHQFGNPSSLHQYGRLARSAIDQARHQVAELVNVSPSQVIFTSGGTEANNLAVQGSIAANPACRKVLFSSIEHASILSQAGVLEQSGCQVSRLPVEATGLLSVNALEKIVQADADENVLISIMTVNNETGVIQDIASLSRRIRKKHEHAVIHSDASQAAGKMSLDFAHLGVDMLTLSAHKMYGPKGAGALILSHGCQLEPVLWGGGHERGWRPGTENVPAIVGFGMAAQLAMDELQVNRQRLQRLQTLFENSLRENIPDAQIFSDKAPRVPSTSCFSIPRIHGEAMVMQLDQHGFAVSSGSACESGTDEPSHVLTAMGVDPDIALGAVRVSFGVYQSESDIDRFCDTLVREVRNLRCSDMAF